MADLPEAINYDAGVYQIETTDPVIGGVNGISNKSAKNLANRTAWLKNAVDFLTLQKANLFSPNFSGSPTVPDVSHLDYTGLALNSRSMHEKLNYMRPWGSDVLSLKMNGAASVGGSESIARLDHVHPTDTSRAPLASPNFSGIPQADTAAAGMATRQIASTQFVVNEIGSARPFEANPLSIKMDGTQAVGANNTVARGDHVHPTDTSRAPVNNPTFTGTVSAPTPASTNNTTTVITSAWAKLGLYSAWASGGYFVFSAPAWLGGWTLQAGYVSKLSGNTATGYKDFPIAFPSQCIWCGLMSNIGMISGTASTEGAEVASFNRFGFNWDSAWQDGDGAGAGVIPFLAIGN